MTPCPLSRRRAAAGSTAARKTSSTFAGQPPSRRRDPWPEQGSRSPRDPADPVCNPPGDQPRASHSVTAAAGSLGPSARSGKSGSSLMLSPRSVAVSRSWADSGVSVQSRLGIDAQQAPEEPGTDFEAPLPSDPCLCVPTGRTGTDQRPGAGRSNSRTHSHIPITKPSRRGRVTRQRIHLDSL